MNKKILIIFLVFQIIGCNTKEATQNEDRNTRAETVKPTSEEQTDEDDFTDEELIEFLSELNELEDKTEPGKIKQTPINNLGIPEDSVIEDQSNPRSLFRLSVSDTGPGIDRERLRTLFNLYGRLEEEIGPNSLEGGMGLTLCQRLAHQLDSKIEVKSTSGSTFFMDIPLEIETADTQLSVPSTSRIHCLTEE